MQPQATEPQPRFPWFSKGVVVLVLILAWWLWASGQPAKRGEEPLSPHVIFGGLGILLALAIIWQGIRYADFKSKVRRGTWGQPSALSRLFASKPTYVGERGGRYTINHKGNKIYKKRR
jgi:hypothetical protein